MSGPIAAAGALGSLSATALDAAAERSELASVPPEVEPPTSKLGDDLARLFRSPRWASSAICMVTWAVTPACWLLVAWHLLRLGAPSSFIGVSVYRALLAYAAIEVPFSIYLYALVQSCQAVPNRRTPFEAEVMHRLFRRSLEAGLSDMRKERVEVEQEASYIREQLTPDDSRAIEFRQQMSRWWLNADWSDLRRDNVKEWLAWSLCGAADYQRLRCGEDGAAELLAFLDECVVLVEARAAHKFPEGYSENVKSIRLELDAVRTTSRPLALYIVVRVLQEACIWQACKRGFRHERQGDLEYLIRLPEAWMPEKATSSTHRPLVVLHGLGVGLSQYASVLTALCEMPTLIERPAIVVLQPWSSMWLGHRRWLRPIIKNEFTREFARALARHDLDRTKFDVLSHSYGTIEATWLHRAFPDRIERSCLVDPVAFCLFEPDVPFSFLYAPPKTSIERLMRYFVATELGHANLLQRHFVWNDNVLWSEDVPSFTDPARTAVVLSGQDAIVAVKRVHQYLLASGMRPWLATASNDAGGVFLDPVAAHGEAMMTQCPSFARVFAWLSRD